ncbi:ankyrin repeat-containing protein, partial [Nicotiana attenuata]
TYCSWTCRYGESILDADVSSLRIVRKNGKIALNTTAKYFLTYCKCTKGARSRYNIHKDKKHLTALHMTIGQDTSLVEEEILNSEHSIFIERDTKGNTVLHIAT